MIATALAFAARGMHVFPCWPRGKTPVPKRGLLEATRDTETIKSWWRRQPERNIAIRTGAVSNLIVIDVDSGEAESALARLEAEHSESLPPSVEVITSRGRHIWFRHPGGKIPNSAGRIGGGIDVRGDGGYVLAPPSIHPSGRAYAWSVDSASAIAAAPQWLIDRPGARDTNGPTPAGEWEQLASEPIRDGARDVTLTRVTGHLLRHYVNVDVVLLSLLGINRAFCAPPLPDSDVRRIVNSIAGAELRRGGCA
jgi:hypothetical protein